MYRYCTDIVLPDDGTRYRYLDIHIRTPWKISETDIDLQPPEYMGMKRVVKQNAVKVRAGATAKGADGA